MFENNEFEKFIYKTQILEFVFLFLICVLILIHIYILRNQYL